MHAAVDTTLLLRTARGDEAAARTLWTLMGSRLVALARGLLRGAGGDAAAMDVVQTVLCRVLTLDRASLAEVQDAEAWLARAVRNESLNYHRAVHRRRGHEPRALMERHGAGAGLGELEGALGELPEGLREIVLLKHAAGLTFDQIALSLGDNRSMVASRYAKALKLLRAWGAEREERGRRVEVLR